VAVSALLSSCGVGRRKLMATAWAPPLVVEPTAQEGSADAAPHGETVAHSGAAERDSAGINSPRGGVTSRGSGLLALAAEDAQHGAGSSGAGLVSSPARSSGRTSEEEEEASPGGAESGSDAASVSAAAGSSAGGAHAEKEKASKPVGARSLLNALPAGLLSLAGGGSGGDSASAEEAQRLRLQVRCCAACLSCGHLVVSLRARTHRRWRARPSDRVQEVEGVLRLAGHRGAASSCAPEALQFLVL
jgi:hypothetical protein